MKARVHTLASCRDFAHPTTAEMGHQGVFLCMVDCNAHSVGEGGQGVSGFNTGLNACTAQKTKRREVLNTERTCAFHVSGDM
mmetsp:Transcript_57260/g.102346  ORF Transcript_57260/g.102346 Transcript_57260/m.102346 type:complete len:82 (+) Transcript_57260:90-335(+)